MKSYKAIPITSHSQSLPSQSVFVPKSRSSFSLLILTFVFAFTVNVGLFPQNTSAATTKLTIGAYNILGANHGGGTSGVDVNAEIIAKKMAYDVVGISEYREYSGDGKETDNGPLIQKLNSDYGGTWKSSKAVKDSTIDQTRLIWNTATVTLVEDTYYQSDNIYDSDKNSMGASENGFSGGGSPFIHIATFKSSATGEEFVVANGHFKQDHTNSATAIRKRQIKNLTNLLASVTVPVFIVGDTNAHPVDETYCVSGDCSNEYSFYTTAKSAGYTMAYTTATEKVNVKYSTVANGSGWFSNKSGHVIDQILYKNIAAPSYYETYGCSSKKTCGSDHRPVRAIFGSLAAASQNSGCVSELDPARVAQNEAWEVGHYGNECTCSEGASTGSMSGDTNFKKITTYLAGKGLNAIAIAGIIGNWRIESTSSLTPFVQQFGSTWPSGGYGLAQWTGSRRTYKDSTGVVDNLKKDTRTKEYFSQYYDQKYSGSAPDSGIPEGVPDEVNDAWLQVELDFMLQEFKQKQYDIGGGYTTLLKKHIPYVQTGDDLVTALNAAKSAGDAAVIFSLIFEKQGDLSTAVSVRAPQADKDISDIEVLIGGGTSDTASVSGSCGDSTGSITGLPDGGVKDTAEGKRLAWQIAQMFIDDLNKKYPEANFPDVNIDADYDDTNTNTPGTGTADTYSCTWAGGASRCGQCYALTAWFVDKFTTAKMGTTTGGGDGVVKHLAKGGVSTGNEAKVYSVFSYGAAEGGSGMHTGVVVGIDGDYAITIENNWGPGGRLVVRKHNKDGATFRDTGAGKTSFAYVSEKFRTTPKEYSE